MWLFMCALVLLPGWVWAYTLTENDYATLKTDITVTHQAEFAPAVANNDDQFISDAYNQPSAPTCWIWRTQVPEKDNYQVTTDIPTTWNWDYFTGLQVPEQNSWIRLWASGPLDASFQPNRDALPKIFKGNAAPQVTHVLAVWRRQALRGETLYVTPQSGACTTAVPAILTFIGYLRPIDVGHALRGVPLQ